MKKIFFIPLIALSLTFFSCSNEDSLDSTSILNTETPELSPLDNYIRDNFTYPYNIEIIYKFDESEYQLPRYLYPPDVDNVEPILNVVKKVWIDSYSDAGGEDFIKRIAPRQLALSGGFNVNPDEGTVTLGYAEAGKKILLFNLDFVDLSDTEALLGQGGFIGTIQHEYAHILNQTKPYDEQKFTTITPTGYTVSWVDTSDAEAHSLGFVSPYARSAPGEDFAEMVRIMLSFDAAEWDDYVANVISNDDARQNIREKEDIVVEYYRTAFDIDFYELQAIVAQHVTEI